MALMIQPPNGYIIALTSILGTLTLSREKKKNYIFLSFYIPFLLFSHIHYFHFCRTTKLPLTLQFKHRHLKRERVKKCKRIKISCALLTATEKNCFKPNVRAYRH